MKKISKKNNLYRIIARSWRGVSLVELIIVLGISSMLIVGSMAWFESRKAPDFYNEMRQVESRVRTAQNENASNVVPGRADCYPTRTPSCPLQGKEEVYGMGVAIKIPASSSTPTKLKTLYLKKLAPVGIPPQSEGIDDYSSTEVELPSSIKLEGFKIFREASDCSTVYNNYRSLPHEVGGGGLDYTAPNQESLMVFRKGTGSYNAFFPNDGVSNLVPANASGAKPVGAFGVPSIDPGWRGSYDDPLYNYTSGGNLTTRLKSQPCAVLWRFGSVERSIAEPSKPRFSAEINFNLIDGTTTLITR